MSYGYMRNMSVYRKADASRLFEIVSLIANETIRNSKEINKIICSLSVSSL